MGREESGTGLALIKLAGFGKMRAAKRERKESSKF